MTLHTVIHPVIPQDFAKYYGYLSLLIMLICDYLIETERYDDFSKIEILMVTPLDIYCRYYGFFNLAGSRLRFFPWGRDLPVSKEKHQQKRDGRALAGI